LCVLHVEDFMIAQATSISQEWGGNPLG